MNFLMKILMKILRKPISKISEPIDPWLAIYILIVVVPDMCKRLSELERRVALQGQEEPA